MCQERAQSKFKSFMGSYRCLIYYFYTLSEAIFRPCTCLAAANLQKSIWSDKNSALILNIAICNKDYMRYLSLQSYYMFCNNTSLQTRSWLADCGPVYEVIKKKKPIYRSKTIKQWNEFFIWHRYGPCLLWLTTSALSTSTETIHMVSANKPEEEKKKQNPTYK